MKIINQSFLNLLIFVVPVSCFAQPKITPNTEQANKPNIIVIFTDDHGFADLGVQGQMDDIKTPHIDQLAAQGVRMTAGYITAPQCTPSRAGLLSGRYQQRFGLEANGEGSLPLTEILIPQRLK